MKITFSNVHVPVLIAADDIESLVNSARISYWGRMDVTKDGAVVVTEVDEVTNKRLRKRTLTLDVLRDGLYAMAREAPYQFSSLLTNNADSVTGDCFIQCCIFGKVEYS